jgi:hypothetical protein
MGLGIVTAIMLLAKYGSPELARGRGPTNALNDVAMGVIFTLMPLFLGYTIIQCYLRFLQVADFPIPLTKQTLLAIYRIIRGTAISCAATEAWVLPATLLDRRIWINGLLKQMDPADLPYADHVGLWHSSAPAFHHAQLVCFGVMFVIVLIAVLKCFRVH